MNANPLDQLLETHAAEQAAQAAQEEAAVQSTLARLNQAISEALGDLYPIIKPSRKPGEYAADHGTVKLTVPFEPCDLELAPFYAHASTKLNYVQFSKHKDAYRGDLFSHDNIAGLLAERRQAYPKWKQGNLDDLTKGPAARLDHSFYHNIAEGEAAALRDELISIDPDQSEKWNRLYKSCIEGLANDRKNKEEAARKAADEKQTADVYAAAYRQYRLDQADALEANGKLFADLQARFDIRFTVWELTYALVAVDEDDEREIETRTAYVADYEPDVAGFWRRYRHHEITRIKYANPVSLRGPLAYLPSEAPAECTDKIIVPFAQASLRFQIHQRLEVEAALSKVEFQPLPVPPTVPEFADYYREHHRIEARVDRELAGESPEPEIDYDVPF